MRDSDLSQTTDRFAGVWRIERRLEDIANSLNGRFSGRARLWPSLDGLSYHEEGDMLLGDAPALRAERKYFWQIQVRDRVDVYFEDGMFFHAFSTNRKTWQAEHICTPDHYVVDYEFLTNSRWQTIWHVSGPRKNYRMLSVFTR